MRDGFRIVDCNRPVMEPTDLWERYLDRSFQHYVGWLVPATDTMLGLHDIFWRPNPHFGRLTSPPAYDPLTENCLMWVSGYPHRDVVPYFLNTV